MALLSRLESPAASKVKTICLIAVVASASSVLNTTTLPKAQLAFQAEPVIEAQNQHDSSKPNFSSIESTAVRKTVFFNYILPIVQQKNIEILALRESIANSKLSQTTLEELNMKYRLDKDANKESLLAAIDIVPPSLVLAQAANESNWGRSRFARDYNNYFGLWCFSKGCGAIPKNRDTEATHEVASYTSLRASIDSYALTLNRNSAYTELRAIRKSQRDNGQAITGLALAKGLSGYAQTGQEYVATIRSMIRYNKLEQYDL